MKILVAEDSEINRRLMEYLFRSMGIDYTIVYNGQEAVDKFRNKDFDWVILDLHMPVMGGYEAALEIRSTKPEAKIIFISGDTTGDQKLRTPGISNVYYLTKPFNQEDLENIFKEI